jgi:OmcA/MtrC family decaheme c-type cytochrome
MNACTKLAAALSIAALALVTGCKGDTGPQGPAGPSGDAGPPGSRGATLIEIPSNSEAPTDASNAMWTALQPQVTVQSVTIASPPVVKFKVTDAVTGAAIAGLGNTSLASGAKYPGYTNLAFAIAKLVPQNNGSPSRWVSYIVTTVPTLTSDGGTTAPGPTRPGTDNTGTLVDNGDGTYAYTFFRDITQTKSQVDGMSFTGANVKADLDDLTYDPTLVHRLTIQLSGNAPGTGSNTPNAVQAVPGVVLAHAADAIYDFAPSTGQAVDGGSGREMVTTANCDTCHRVLGGIPGGSPEANGAGFHGGNRNDVRYCVVCHTEQRKFGRTEAAFDPTTLTFKSADGGTDINTTSTYRVYDRAIGRLPNFIHHIHGGGSVLALKNYNFAGVTFNDVLYPQDLRNCTKCHDPSNPATPQASNFENVPNRVACGGCHDGIDFATGKGVTMADALQGKTSSPQGHLGGIQPDDTQCAACHSDPTRPDINIDAVHRPVTPPAPDNALVLGGTNVNTNAAWIASNPARLPVGAIVPSYDIKSVSLVNVANGVGNPQMVFRILQNGQRKDFNDPVSSTPNPATGQTEIWDGFMGAPSIYFVFSVPQDGDSTPSDYNAAVNGYLRTIWNKSASSVGSLTGPDANGYYTVTLGSNIPTSAVMVTGGVGYSYNNNNTLPLTQTNLPAYPVTAPTATGLPCATSATNACRQGGLIVIAPNAQKVATGFTGRRPIVEDARCNACHQELGAFTTDAFHAGQRNDGTTCSWCHTPNKTSNGWSADSTYFVHAIHAADKRQFPFTWDASSTTESFADVGYPGVLNDCQTCHLPGTYDFSASASASALPHKQYRTVATGVFNPNSGTTIDQPYSFKNGGCVKNTNPQTDLGVFELSPYITTLNVFGPYGVPFSFNAGASTANSCDEAGNVIAVPPQGSTPVANTATNLVNSPVAGVCIACHDTDAAQAHFTINGGSIYKARGTALNTVETCMICHGPGAIADIAQVHKP